MFQKFSNFKSRQHFITYLHKHYLIWGVKKHLWNISFTPYESCKTQIQMQFTACGRKALQYRNICSLQTLSGYNYRQTDLKVNSGIK